MKIERDQLFRIFFLAVFLFLLFELLKILSPFYTGILGAVVLTLIFFPLNRMILSVIGEKRVNLAASLSTFLVLFLIILPFIFFTWLLLNEVPHLVPYIRKVGETVERLRQGESFGWLKSLEAWLSSFVDVSQFNFEKMLTKTGTDIVNALVSVGKSLPKNTFALVINVVGMVFALFFLFRDGQYFFRWAKELVPMEKKHQDQVFGQIYLTVTAVVRGVFLVAAAQAGVATVGYFIVGAPSALLLGFATMFAAIIPFVGAGVIWLPVGIYYLVQGVTWKAVFLLLWGFLAVSTVDNFLRPFIIGYRTKLPMIFLFFGILGGLKMYGPMGIFLGPLVVALLMAFIKIYREEYR